MTVNLASGLKLNVREQSLRDQRVSTKFPASSNIARDLQRGTEILLAWNNSAVNQGSASSFQAVTLVLMSLSIPNAPNAGLFKPGYQKYVVVALEMVIRD